LSVMIIILHLCLLLLMKFLFAFLALYSLKKCFYSDFNH
jgi:hypothetical protein